MTCNLIVTDFAILGSCHDPVTGLCRTKGCPYGSVGSHPVSRITGRCHLELPSPFDIILIFPATSLYTALEFEGTRKVRFRTVIKGKSDFASKRTDSVCLLMFWTFCNHYSVHHSMGTCTIPVNYHWGSWNDHTQSILQICTAGVSFGRATNWQIFRICSELRNIRHGQ